MENQPTNEVIARAPRSIRGFPRKHPVLTVLGAGGILLIGGAELAAGVVIGAALDAVLRRQTSRDETVATQPVQERPNTLYDRVPRVVRDRARAIYDAARGKQPSAIQ